MVPSASKALGLSSPKPALAGVMVADAIPVLVLEPVLEDPWADIVFCCCCCFTSFLNVMCYWLMKAWEKVIDR